MTTIEIDDNVYKDWVRLYEAQDKVEYPSLKNFTTKRLKELILKEFRKADRLKEEKWAR